MPGISLVVLCGTVLGQSRVALPLSPPPLATARTAFETILLALLQDHS